MKKLLSLLLCIVFVCFALVGCAEDVIGEYLSNYNTNTVTDDQIEKLNFYIITGDNTSPEAKITVPQNINTYLKEKYQIELNIKYYTALEYDSAMYAAVNNTDESERPDIVLINSEAMFNTLYSKNALVDLNAFYESRDFRSINTIVDDVLLAASVVTDPESNTSTYYTVPNNHVIGEYKYIVIDKAMARDTLHFSNAEIAAMTTEASLEELKDAIANYYNSDDTAYIDKHVKIVSGDYNDKLLLEYGVEGEIPEGALKKNVVNINAYPNATKEQAFLSAFAIIKHLDDVGEKTEEERAILDNHYTKCMKIIYALNTDAQLKNMLQYGYVGTNYKFVKNEKNENTNYIQLIKNAEVSYEMDNIHTGNMFLSYYVEKDYGWTNESWNEKVYNDYLRQNADAKTPEQKLETESNALTFDLKVNSETVYSLPAYGSTFSDLTISWTSNSENAVVNSDGSLTFVCPSDDVEKIEAVVIATLSCCGDSVDKVFNFVVEKTDA